MEGAFSPIGREMAVSGRSLAGAGEDGLFAGVIAERGDHQVLHLEVPAKHLAGIVAPSLLAIGAASRDRQQALDRDHARRIAAYLVRRGGGAVMGPLTLAAPSDAVAIRPAPGGDGLVRANVRPSYVEQVTILDDQHRRRAIHNVFKGDPWDFPSGAAYSPDRLAEAAAALAERPIALDIYPSSTRGPPGGSSGNSAACHPPPPTRGRDCRTAPLPGAQPPVSRSMRTAARALRVMP